jgi:glutamate dehydrogenase
MKEDGTLPQFYSDYVKQVQKVIKENATLEFEAIWREHEASGEPRSILSDTLSIAITKMDEELQKSELWDDVAFRHSVLSEALPNLLLEKIGLETILKRVSRTEGNRQ